MTPDPSRTPVIGDIGTILGHPVQTHLGGHTYIHTPRGSYLAESDGAKSIIFSYVVNELRNRLRGYRRVWVMHSVPSAVEDTLVARFGTYQLWGNSGLFLSTRKLGPCTRDRYNAFWITNDAYPGARLYFPNPCYSLSNMDEIAKAFLSVYDNLF